MNDDQRQLFDDIRQRIEAAELEPGDHAKAIGAIFGDKDGATPAAAWRRHELVTLPSGKRAKLRRPDVIDLIMDNGQIPDFFTPVIMAGLRGQDASDQDQDADQFEVTPENLGGVFDLLNKITRAAFVEPVISDKPESELGANEIRLEHVGFNDKAWIMNWSMGSDGAAAGRFRAQSAGSVGSVSPGDGDQPGAVSDRRRRTNK